MTRPNLFLVAAPRSGSTQLAAWLASHPLIALPQVKEPNFFSQEDFPESYVSRTYLNDIDPEAVQDWNTVPQCQFAVFRSKMAYRDLFSAIKAPWSLDASTSYLASPHAARAIREFAPDARILLLTRNPVDRAISHYRLAIRTGRTRASLTDEIDREINALDPPGARYLLRPSAQSAGAERFHAAFPSAQILSVSFEEMIRSPLDTVTQIAKWLEIPQDAFDLSINAQNGGAHPRFPGLNAWMLRTGIKTRLRRAIPKPVKSHLKAIWFDPDQKIDVSESERARLAALLEGA